jgi:hypothetical protein
MRPRGATKSGIDAEEWPTDEEADTFARINVIVCSLRKLLEGHIAIETFHGGGYRARWINGCDPKKPENYYEKAHYRRAS